VNVSGWDIFFSEEGFVFDPFSGFAYSLNNTGAFIFGMLRQGVGIPEIVQALIEEFEVDAKTANEDVRDFLQQLSDFRLGEV